MGCEVLLANERGERKATGSYYTPDYIVDYIVRQTLGPVLDGRQTAFAAAMDRIAEMRGRLAKTLDAGANRQLRSQLAGAERDAAEAFLGIKVCDPAMGSGHFLVNAVDFLTDGIILRMQAYHDSHAGVPWEWNPIRQTVERVRGEIVGEMARQGIGLDAARLDDTSLLTRLVLKRCIYGVDLNPMAVELAKLSLWLHSFTVGAPLSFLDHHLRWGNSLIGSDVRTVEAAIAATDSGQMALWGGPFAGLLALTTTMLEIAGRADTTLADVRQSADEFAAMQAALTPYKQALDLWVSQWFDEGRKTKDHGAAFEFMTVHGADVLPALRGERALAEKYETAIERARVLWAEKRFFHWDLEFPEVFVDLARRDWAENPGFDAVIGNPPYDELSEDARGQRIDEMVYLQAIPQFASALGYRINLYRLFISKALSVIREGGWHSFIVPLSLLADRFTYSLRKALLESVRIHNVEQFPQKDDPHDRVFFDAKLSTCVYVIEKALPEDHSLGVRTHSGREIIDSSPRYSAPQASISRFDSDNLSIPGVGQQSWDLILRLAVDTRFTRLGEMAKALPGELMINRQFEPYLTDAVNGEEIIRGSHIGMYAIVEPKQGEALYLNRIKFLAEHTESAKAQHHQARRVIYQRYAAIDNYRRLIATILPAGFFCSHTVGYLQIIERDIELGFLVALLNSKLLDWRFNLTSTNNNVNGYEVEALPTRRIAFTAPAADRARYAEEGRRLYEQCGATGDAAPVLGFVEHHLVQGQSDVVHDILSFLAEQMIAMNKAKQAEVKGFLAWLAREIGAPIDTLNNKTVLQNYLGAYQKGESHATLEELLAVLRQNRRKLTVDPSARAFQERLQAEHGASLAKLLPLKARLAATDRLIDQAVYKLYGLTDDEITIVEGR